MRLLSATLILSVLGLAGCTEKKSRNFFAAGGIKVGPPVAVEGGAYRIPIDFETEIVHSGQWIDSVDTRVAGTNILVTAQFTTGKRKSRYPGHIEVRGAGAGTYALAYRNPDGSLHPVGRVELPAR